MNIKRISSFVVGGIVCLLLIFGWVKFDEGGPVPYPVGTGDFYTIGSATIDPTTLLDDVRNGDEPLLTDIRQDFPEDTPFITTIEWSQSDYLEIAKALHKVIWKDNPDEWHLYRALFYSRCDNSQGKFEIAELIYYQEIKINRKTKYSARSISLRPENGYVAWGGDSIFPRPLFGWGEIDLEKITKFPAEKALALAEQQGGSDIRKAVGNSCWIHVYMWPWGFGRRDWNVVYGGNRDITNGEFWISVK